MREGFARDWLLLLTQPRKMFQSVFVAVLLLDFAVKQVVISTMELGYSIALWPGVFHLTFVRNEGAAFSLLQGYYWVFYIAMALLVGLVIWFWLQEKPNQWLPVIGTALVCAGAAGNLVDRLISGSVVDIFDFRLINFAVFNVADIGITIGCALFFYWFIFQSSHLTHPETAPTVVVPEEVISDSAAPETASATVDSEITLTSVSGGGEIEDVEIAPFEPKSRKVKKSRKRDTSSKSESSFARAVKKVEGTLQKWEDELSDEGHD